MSQGPFLRKYGVQTTVDFDLFEVDGVDFHITAVHSTGDTKVMKDEADENDTANAFVDEGQSYSIVLTAAEMQAARVKILIVDLTATKAWLDTSLTIETYGNSSAEHEFDLDSATVDVGKIGGDATVLANLKAVYSGILTGQTQTGTLTTLIMTTDLTEATNTLVDSCILFTSGNLKYESQRISAYSNNNGQITVAKEFTQAPADGDAFVIVGNIGSG